MSAASARSTSERTWDQMLKVLYRFNEREGHCCVPMNHVEKEDGTPLGAWLEEQLAAMTNGSLSWIHQQKLKHTGVVWADEKVLEDEFWDKEVLDDAEVCDKTFASKKNCKISDETNSAPHKHNVSGQALNTPRDSVSVSDNMSGRVPKEILENAPANDCRNEFHTDPDWGLEEDMNVDEDRPSQSHSPEKEKVKKRTSCTPKEKVWEAFFGLLKEFKVQYGHVTVPRKYMTTNGTTLGRWLYSQQDSNHVGRLDPRHLEQLEALGVNMWKPAGTRERIWQEKWDKMACALIEYKKRNGTCSVPRSYKEKDINLGEWLRSQKRLKKQGRLPRHRIKRLEEIGLLWHYQDCVFDNMMSLLASFKKRERHINVPCEHKENGAWLGRWLRKQVRAMKDGHLDPHRQQHLEEVGIDWKDKIWETKRKKIKTTIVARDEEDGSVEKNQQSKATPVAHDDSGPQLVPSNCQHSVPSINHNVSSASNSNVHTSVDARQALLVAPEDSAPQHVPTNCLLMQHSPQGGNYAIFPVYNTIGVEPQPLSGPPVGQSDLVHQGTALRNLNALPLLYAPFGGLPIARSEQEGLRGAWFI